MSSIICPDEIHIWQADLSRWDSSVLAMLSTKEQGRGRRFIRPEHQRRFMMARGALRQILAKYLALAPGKIRFIENNKGKIYLEDYPQLQFNVTHSQDLALYAVNIENEIGIDLEWINPNLAVQPLLERFFSATEQQSVLGLPISQQVTAFYQLWTRKEASLKALGLGLSGLTDPNLQLPQALNLELATQFAAAVACMGRDVKKTQIKYYLVDIDC